MLSSSHAASELPTPGSTSRRGRRWPSASWYNIPSEMAMTRPRMMKRR